MPETPKMLSDAILACKDLEDLARLFLGYPEDTVIDQYPNPVRGPTERWPTNNGAVLRHVFKLVQTETNPEPLRHLDWYAYLLRTYGFTIPMSMITERRAENQKLKDKLNWFPPGMEPN